MDGREPHHKRKREGGELPSGPGRKKVSVRPWRTPDVHLLVHLEQQWEDLVHRRLQHSARAHGSGVAESKAYPENVVDGSVPNGEGP
jgi:hypothetical protein